MPKIDLRDCFPEPPDLSVPRGPLPKQSEFIQDIFDPDGPKYVRYCGGIGSGKTLIGCIAMLSLAVQYPGDYLICRQYYPELMDTTYKAFQEICPEGLILENKIAERRMVLRSANGAVSNILFRPLEDPEKLRSLNLNAFYIDEANQCSEAAFTLLQGRLRGRHVRKGILTQNSGGHDWTWRWFVKQDMIKDQETKNKFKNIYAPSTENVHLPEGYVETILSTWSQERIDREIYANEDSFEGMVYTEFRYDIHVIRPFNVPKDWTRVIGADHGYRNPACWLWGAVNGDGDVFIYREFYEREWTIDEICQGKKDASGNRIADKPGVNHYLLSEKTDEIRMDPSIRKNQGQKETEWEEYLRYLPASAPLLTANNKKEIGIDRVKQYLKLDERHRPKLYIFNNCINLLDELSSYRYQELTISQQGKANEKEEPLKVNDHACDALRYLIMTRPEPYQDAMDFYRSNKVAYDSSAGHLHRHLAKIKAPKTDKDPFGDY